LKFRGVDIEVVAGGVGVGYSEEVTEARKSPIDSPSGLAVDASGNLYFADTGNNIIRRVDKMGKIITVAGTQNKKASLTDGPARKVRLNAPSGLAFDLAGTLYFAEKGGERVRKLTPQGSIVTLAGTGKAGFSGDGGSALKARLNSPSELAIDAKGNVYVSDIRNHRVRKIDTQGRITTIAGNGKEEASGDGGLATQAGIGRPRALAFDARGELYLATSRGIRRISKSGGIATLPQTEGEIVHGLAFDASYNLYFSKIMDSAIYYLKADGSVKTLFKSRSHSFYPSQRGSNAKGLVDPSALAFDGEKSLYVADSWVSSVVRIPLK